MTTYHIHPAASPISNLLAEQYGPGHIHFTDNPQDEGLGRVIDSDKVRVYSPEKLKRVKEGLDKLEQEGRRISVSGRLANRFTHAREYIRTRQLFAGDGNDSERRHEWRGVTNEQLIKYLSQKIAPYFIGMPRVDLYASISRRTSDVEIADRILGNRTKELELKRKVRRDRADVLFQEIMAIPARTLEPRITPPERRGFTERLLKLLHIDTKKIVLFANSLL